MNKIKRYFKGVVEQAHMVRWPTKKELFKAVGVVLTVVIISAIALSLSDLLISNLLKMLENQRPSSSSSEEEVEALINIITLL